MKKFESLAIKLFQNFKNLTPPPAPADPPSSSPSSPPPLPSAPSPPPSETNLRV